MAFWKKPPKAEIVLLRSGEDHHATVRLFHRLVEVAFDNGKSERHAMIPSDDETEFFAHWVSDTYRRGYTVRDSFEGEIPDKVWRAAHGMSGDTWW